MEERFVKNTLIGLIMLTMPVSASAFSWDEFWGPVRGDGASPASNGAGTSVENDISVSASTGGNSASGASGNAGGAVTTGEARASATVETRAGDEGVSAVQIEIATEGEPAVVERHVATSSRGTRVETSVRVEVNPVRDSGRDPVSNGASAGDAVSNGASDTEQASDDEVEGTAEEEVSSAARSKVSIIVHENRARIRAFFRALAFRLSTLFDF